MLLTTGRVDIARCSFVPLDRVAFFHRCRGRIPCRACKSIIVQYQDQGSRTAVVISPDLCALVALVGPVDGDTPNFSEKGFSIERRSIVMHCAGDACRAGGSGHVGAENSPNVLSTPGGHLVS